MSTKICVSVNTSQWDLLCRRYPHTGASAIVQRALALLTMQVRDEAYAAAWGVGDSEGNR